ncbi:MAG: glycosyltransferase [Planctomycetes bacterium]|jgi:glycosyltransferase involved in cell wall biosynthesis|nr:glycosyltransferase [Planctomycetota bacterium]
MMDTSGKDRSIRVLYCILDNRCGGPHRLAHAAAGRLRAQGIETLFLLGHKARETWRPEGFEMFLCRRIQCLRRRHPVWNFLAFCGALPGNLWRLRRLIRAHDIDVVHVDGVTNFVPALAARLAGRPIIWLYNDYVSRPLQRVLLPLVTALAATVVVQGRSLRETLTAGRPRLRDKTVVLYSGVDTDRFRVGEHTPQQRRQIRQELGLPQDALVIGTVRNVNRLKGYTHFLEAAATVKRKIASAKFLVVGRRLDTDPGYWDHLQRLTARLGLTQDVVYTGFRDDVPALLSALDVFVLASLQESCPVALLEAMASQVGVVATDVGAVREMVHDGRSGLVVPPGDAQALADAVTAYLQMAPQDARRLCAAARQEVETRFAIDAIARQQAKLYESLLPGTSRME